MGGIQLAIVPFVVALLLAFIGWGRGGARALA